MRDDPLCNHAILTSYRQFEWIMDRRFQMLDRIGKMKESKTKPLEISKHAGPTTAETDVLSSRKTQLLSIQVVLFIDENYYYRGTSQFAFFIEMARDSTSCLFFLLPAAREHIIQRLLERTAVHVNQAALLLGLGISNNRDEAEISRATL